jgi:ribosomal protein L15
LIQSVHTISSVAAMLRHRPSYREPGRKKTARSCADGTGREQAANGGRGNQGESAENVVRPPTAYFVV